MHQVPCIKTQGGHMPVSPSNRRQWLAMGTALISLSCAASAASTTYPSKPLRILVPYAAGGASDNIARQIAAAITGQTGQAVGGGNRPGGSGGVAGPDRKKGGWGKRGSSGGC